MEKEFSWVLCPVCGKKLFKHYLDGDVHIEISCSSCRAIQEISITEGEVSFKQVAHRRDRFKPDQFKG